jgi:hypothetical protein
VAGFYPDREGTLTVRMPDGQTFSQQVKPRARNYCGDDVTYVVFRIVDGMGNFDKPRVAEICG